MVGSTARRASQTAQWSEALNQLFSEPWRVRPVFQPIVALERGSVWGFQVLARFISPVAASPPEWLDEAERLGLREALELKLLGSGLQALAEMPERCRLLLPLSPVTALTDSVRRELSRHVTSLPRVVLDLTADGAQTVDVPALVDALAPMRRDGGRIAVIAGRSPGGLDALAQLRPDVVKVGPDLIAELDADSAQRAVVQGLVELVGVLGGRVVAVGIEHEAQLETLAQVGITLAQGFALARPVPSMAAGIMRAER